jgi:hypothetical protein
MSTFDQILDATRAVLREHEAALAAIGPIFVNRDLNGRVRLIVQAACKQAPLAREALDSIGRGL